MKILIAEDDFASRKFLTGILSEYGDCHQVIDGEEAVEAFTLSLNKKDYYNLVCLDIMMPKIDGIKVLKQIRELEKDLKIPKENKCKIIMISALNEKEIVLDSFDTGSEGYAVKPLNTEKFFLLLEKLKIKKLHV